uniref:SRCR domain-containing protein n=1 Tax=Capitella teleta TaxID=283909 RepID=X2B479_CAPTE
MRLVGGLGPYEGRVEVLNKGQWGTICDDGWSDLDASVVCKQLNYTRAFFGAGSGPVWMNNVNCDGIERHLGLCGQTEFSSSSHVCQHDEDAGVTCDVDSLDQSSIDVKLRLSGGPSPRVGRLEIFYNGTWGSVCEDGFRDREAVVACRSLGFELAEVSYGRNWDGQYAPSEGPVWLDRGLECLGMEQNIALCEHSGWGQSNCDYTGDVILSCLDVTPTPPPPQALIVRLVGGPSAQEGRLEVLYRGAWGTVCDDDFDALDAAVFCRMLGFNGTARYMEQAYGPGDDDSPVWLDDMQCKGNETSAEECVFSGLEEIVHCWHSEDVSIACLPQSEQTDSAEMTTTPSLSLRLQDGPNAMEGRVEVLYNGTWGTVCDDDFGDEDASVVCSMLGYIFGGEPLGSLYGPANDSVPIWLNEVECEGGESLLTQCAFLGLDRGDPECNHDQDVSLRCFSDPAATPLRLHGGATEADGWLEIYHDGRWGRICGDFGTRGAQVACNSLGLSGNALVVKDKESTANEKFPTWLTDVECSGQESSLLDCEHPEYDESSCWDHDDDAYVQCGADLVPLRLEGGSHPGEGRVEVFFQGVWGTICNEDFDDEDAQVVCRSLGLSVSEARELTFSNIAIGEGQIWLESLDCLGSESNVMQCNHDGWGQHNCYHHEDVRVSCGSPS